MDYFRAQPRGWSFETSQSALFTLKFFRGNWTEPRWARLLPGPSLKALAGKRRPGEPQREVGRILPRTLPAQLTVSINATAKRLQLELEYEVIFATEQKAIGAAERRFWKSSVESDVQGLEELLVAHA